ncbi:MAG TPA: type 2 lanthipeptide synthetase LanM family protein, partial [Labilithrix sp.]|nr:type 2 lanthipeptide synthetase LanM family protein [Labilithrix sp.]
MTEASLLDLLDEDDTALAARLTTPGWMRALDEAFAGGTRSEHLSARIAAIAAPTPRAELRLAAPLLEAPFLELRSAIARFIPRLPCEAAWLEGALFDQLVSRLEMPLLRSLALAVNVARVRGELAGATPEERFEDFVRQRVGAGRGAFFADCPVLARHVLAIATLWSSASALLLRDLADDLASIGERFWPGADPGRIIKLDGGMGDVHRGGRAVTILHFEGGQRVVYKPHSLAVDGHFGALLAELNRTASAHGILDMRPVGTLSRGDHGYAEFLATSPCASTEEMARFFRRQGQNLALMFGLEGTDIHSENVLAHGEYPVIIDLEAMFHPRVHHTAMADPASRAFSESVLRILFLPDRVESGEGRVGFDLSALGDRPGQMSPKPEPQMVELGTDTMHVERRPIPLEASAHRPTINGREVDVMSYLEQVCEGFATMARCLVAKREALLGGAGAVAAFADDEVRILVRDTSYYDRLLRASYHPPFLRDGLERDRLFDHLYQDVAVSPTLARLVDHERTDLWLGDIPAFTTRASSTDVVASNGAVIRGVFEKSGFDSAAERLRGLDQRTIDRELWLIRASFATIPLGKGEAHWKSSRLEPSARVVSKDELLHRACAVGDRLLTLAYRRDGRASWLGLMLFGEVEWDLTPIGVGLYDGSLGIALFLGYLARASGVQAYADLALDVLNGVRAMTIEHLRVGGDDGLGIGGGPVSFVFAATHLSQALGRPDLALEAEAKLGVLATLVAQPDAPRDVVGGIAGALYATLALHRVGGGAESLRVARLAAERLAALAIPQPMGIAWKPDFAASAPLAGFSHGASGIGLGLARFGAAVGDETAARWTELALAAVRYEDSASSGDNWYDYRSFEAVGPALRTMCTWCHGAPGVGFARAGLLDLGVENGGALARDLAVAAMTTEREGFGLNHSLCHGDLGNVELLAVAARALGDDALDAAYRSRLAQIADSVERMGWSCGVPLGVESPGLFTGIAGIGYAWLRAALPDEVPSLLLLDAPPRAGT